jgi:hypothetical protein
MSTNNTVSLIYQGWLDKYNHAKTEDEKKVAAENLIKHADILDNGVQDGSVDSLEDLPKGDIQDPNQNKADAAKFDGKMRQLPVDIQNKLKEKFGGADTEEEKAQVVRYLNEKTGTDDINQEDIETLRKDLGLPSMTTHQWTYHQN